MKNIRLTKLNKTYILGLIIILAYGCERDVTDDAVPATFSNQAEVFTDTPRGLTDEFFESFDPAEGYNVEDTFEVVDDEAYEGNASIRIDVPSSGNPNGFLAGGIFRDRGVGRDLTGFDALTFWAKGTITGTIASVGFGIDFEENKFEVSALNEIELTTNWTKYIIPIPDASKLVQERGLFSYIAAPFDYLGDGPNGNEIGWTFWIDEIKFEKLGTLGQPRPRIYDGADAVQEAFTGSTIQIPGLTYTANLPTGGNLTVNTSPSYFNFSSSNPSVATVSELGAISVVGTGTAIITATLGSELAQGSVELNSVGAFPSAPIPTRDPANVISLFSDAYANVPVRHYNGFFQFATTQGGAGADPNNVDLQVPLPGGGLDNIINYTQLNFVSIGTYETVPLVNISTMTHLHVDINIREELGGGDFLRLSMESGTGTGSTSFGSVILSVAQLSNVDENGWLSLDLPISSFVGFTDLSALGQLFFVSDATISDIWVDNVYFYNE